ncbi:peptidoglycan DD-metalloendopeptidase family protein [Geomonas sp. Red69]|uniref:Peptidoglycan DD-metalloendopeptidase family protein n=1 Tax=Geomonas diazotrophica TaxID=2843197 RepID=A0ABX8JGJ7_9BACT|nr:MULTISPECIES: peptidoglycan DD-metalloendopeptidase family protein [Geomonas]MBU5637731.1 peptidoglycan DD-metalloendopeptidase family protein [Geomonas diazotrophica]QWV96266.1 peptidoglycan DD-metalloendopeptidase family protein [Geomonas nitrogeniifigens]QXE85333.1 peptidoglycan DD-metalloendopeptidase family protein [Geomonas nitrogeniifigens]
MRHLTATILLVLALLAPALCRAGANEELQNIKKQIKEKNRLISKTQKVETKVSGELVQIQKSLAEKQSNLAALGRDLAGVEKGIDQTHDDIERERQEAERKKAQINRRVAALYKGGDTGNLRVFFSSESFPQMSENLRYMRSILANDKKLFQQYNENLERLNRLKERLEQEAVKKEGLRRSIEAKKREIEQEKSRKATYLVKVRQDKQSYLASLKELQANASRLQSMIQRLEAKSRKAYSSKGRPGKGSEPARPGVTAKATPVPNQGLGAQKGRLSLPVRGNVIDRFGRHKHPEFDSFTVSNGISVAAPAGSAIHAIYDGEVIFADYFKGYGNMIIVDHGDGFFSLYAHASSIAKRVGSKVSKNDVLASVGDVDSTKGPMLYFEIRYQGKPVDPSPWFR